MDPPEDVRNKTIFRIHHEAVHLPRVDRIARGMADLAVRAETMLDIGCGNGLLARDIAARVGAKSVRGVDVKVREETAIPVEGFDGKELPFADASFDLVTIADVLHHAEDPEVLVREAIRVLSPDGKLVIKDHFRVGPVSNAVLLAMDVLGNYSTGVLVRGRYLSPSQWVALVAEGGGNVDRLVWPFVVHRLPWSLVARNEYQFLMRVVPRK
jgi:2-polyprenyl-3-methyl-5-hydroxy-6-metoxy-1,4-benzoquinol methylase